jgi:murein DD-endopeptidase MepM/ murein hydrolase activator NlpD
MNKIIVCVLILFSVLSCKKNDDFVSDGVIGTPMARTCDNPQYEFWEFSSFVLPYPVGESRTIGLNNCSSSYHASGQPDQFAIDFNMPIGSTITCSKSGSVIFVEESGEDYDFPNNKVVIDHGDGTFGQYMHLTENGASVTLGQNVFQGSIIGQSGATGLAGYPHLHFVITENGWEYPYDSYPVNFRNTTENPNSLESGETYTALPF